MKLTDWFLGNKPQALELKRDVVRAKIDLPTAPVLDVTPWSLGRYASKSELVYACIEKKAQVACDPELIVQRRTSKGDWEKVEGHRALDTLLNPNPWDDGESFLRTWIASENIAGIFYAEIVRNGAGEPINLYPLRPDCVFPQYKETSKGRMLDYYAYRINGREVRFKEEELLIHRLHGLGSMYSGLSPLAVALASVDADIAATEYVRDFFNNDGTPSGLLKFTGKNMDETELQRTQQKWKSLYARGGKNRGGVAVLDERVDYQTIGAQLNELDNEALTSIDETRICMAFGVPPVLIGAYVGLKNVNQKASFKGAMEEFWMNTMSPELKAIRKFLTRKYLPFFEDEALIKTDKIRFFWDISTVDALQEDIDAIHDRVALGYKTGFYKLDEARAKVGLDPVGPELGGEEFYKAPAPVGQQPEDEEDEEKLTEKRQKSILDADTLEKKTFEFEGLTLSREPTLLEQSIDIKAIFDSYESGTESLTKIVLDIRKELTAQAAKAITKLAEADVHTLSLTPPTNAYKRIRKPIEAAVRAGKQQVSDEFTNQAKGAWIHAHYEVKGLIDDIISRLVDLTVSRIVGQVTSAAIDVITALGVLGYSEDDIEERVKQELDDRSDKPFEGISRQAINSAVNAGRREEMRERADDIRVYEYSAILDPALCENCEDWDGKQSEDLDDLPETPNIDCLGGANCRCFIISIFNTEEA